MDGPYEGKLVTSPQNGRTLRGLNIWQVHKGGWTLQGLNIWQVHKVDRPQVHKMDEPYEGKLLDKSTRVDGPYKG